MPRGISPAEAAARLSAAGSASQDRYQKGTAGKGNAWLSGASASEANYQAGVQAAIGKKKFSSGVQRAGATAYDQGVQNKGALNWSTGMQFASTNYQKGVQKVASLWNQPLSTPRGPKGSPNNLKRMTDNVQRFQQAANS